MWARVTGIAHEIERMQEVFEAEELERKLEPAEEGLFRLKPAFRQEVAIPEAPTLSGEVRFVLQSEISSIYKKGGKTRKVHNVIFAPSLEAVAQIQIELEKVGNIRSDGRPILGLPSRDLLEIILGVDEHCHLIPAHIWTPWFSMLLSPRMLLSRLTPLQGRTSSSKKPSL